MINNQIMSVNDINLYIKNLLSGDSLLCSLWVKGEISNFKHHSSGHMYFSLKDQYSTIKCVMFKSHAQKMRFKPAHGMQVVISGYVSVYERDGAYQFYVDDMIVAGAGALHMAFEQLKNKLEAEGLFDPHKKRPIPSLPKTIGVVTSPTGAAIRDIISIIKRRNPKQDIRIVPAVVQGVEGIASLCNALDKLYDMAVDVVIVGRGGGSLEELWCFNEEKVVRKIAMAPIPIISAVGHETDFTLADFAADLRAATPSMAAEMATPVLMELKYGLSQKSAQLANSYLRTLKHKRQSLNYLSKRTIWSNPERLLNNSRQMVDTKRQQLNRELMQILKDKRANFETKAGALDALSPLKVLARGYSLCYDSQGKVLKDSNEVQVTDNILVQLSKGSLQCRVIDAKEDQHG